ncbi:multidrug ABC transporter ATP-binding protein [Candidatus Bathyarchaeota archaeon ex4484_205]|nr:MAG: multidrug ABC transporter ATP-binding protein [Candidatus Bathyarchaeota archaeon ex4484_205]RLG67248.1 MAG: multidrug ABC transporter ATP-binding protein [archaeon]
MEIVEVEDVVKIYDGKVRALDGMSFKVGEGEIFGIIGPNGAGKTTMLRILATLLQPTSGRVTIYGLDVVKDADRIREIISYLPEEAGAFKNLSGYENLRFMAELYEGDTEALIQEAERISGLGERLKDKVKTYSKGMLRRLLLARALMVKPRLAILDEPTSGLDVIHAHYVRKTIKEYARNHGVTVVVSSHNMLEVEYLCDRMILINKGKILLSGKPRELIERYNSSNLEEVFVEVAGNA